MIISFSTDTIARGGKERQLFILSKKLTDKKIKVQIITRDYSTNNYLEEYRINESIVYKLKNGSIYQRFKDFRRSIEKIKPDINIALEYETAFFSLLLYRKYNFKFINASIRHGIRLFKLTHIIRSVICFFSPYVIANSHAGLRANNLKSGKRRFVLYNGIEQKFSNSLTLDEIQKKRTEIIHDYASNPGTIYISVANLIPYKDYYTVLKALRNLKDQKSFYYFIIGDGPMFNDIERIIADYGLAKRVFLVGRIENVQEYLFISDIMIHSSRGEGISNAILEGMFAGLPIIATDVGGIPETVYSGSSMLFPYKDEKALFECLIKAPLKFASFDKNSEDYKNHLSKFSVGTMMKRFEEIIATVINKE